MSINGVSAKYYSTAYTKTNPTKSTDTASFADTIAEKAAASKIDWDEEAGEIAAGVVNADWCSIFRNIEIINWPSIENS